MRVEVLGAVRVWRQEHELTLGHPRQRALLAMLAVRASRPVGRDELIDGIWGSDPPATAANCVHSYVARLRLVLEPGRAARAPSSVLASAGPGYALRLDAGQVDANVFAGHLVRPASCGRPVIPLALSFPSTPPSPCGTAHHWPGFRARSRKLSGPACSRSI